MVGPFFAPTVRPVRFGSFGNEMVPGVGFEPTHSCERRILSPLRLPFRHPGTCTDGIIAHRRPFAIEDIIGSDNETFGERNLFFRQRTRR